MNALLEYQLNDYLEIKLRNKDQKLIAKLKQNILKVSSAKVSSLCEFPALGISNTCVIFSNESKKNLKKICLINPDGSLREIAL